MYEIENVQSLIIDLIHPCITTYTLQNSRFNYYKRSKIYRLIRNHNNYTFIDIDYSLFTEHVIKKSNLFKCFSTSSIKLKNFFQSKFDTEIMVGNHHDIEEIHFFYEAALHNRDGFDLFIIRIELDKEGNQSGIHYTIPINDNGRMYTKYYPTYLYREIDALDLIKVDNFDRKLVREMLPEYIIQSAYDFSDKSIETRKNLVEIMSL